MEFSTDYFPSHQKGARTRLEILKVVLAKPEVELETISSIIGKSIDQTKRHLKRLTADGKLHKWNSGYRIGRQP